MLLPFVKGSLSSLIHGVTATNSGQRQARMAGDLSRGWRPLNCWCQAHTLFRRKTGRSRRRHHSYNVITPDDHSRSTTRVLHNLRLDLCREHIDSEGMLLYSMPARSDRAVPDGGDDGTYSISPTLDRAGSRGFCEECRIVVNMSSEFFDDQVR